MAGALGIPCEADPGDPRAAPTFGLAVFVQVVSFPSRASPALRHARNPAMHWRFVPWLPLLAGSLLASGLFAQSKLTWVSGLDAALADAAKKNTIVVIAINMPGERGSDSVMREHYANARLADLAENTVNLLILVGPDGSKSPDEPEVRRRYLKVPGETPVAAPHHLFVKPVGEGELLSAIAYRTTIAELEWAWVDALRKVRPDFAWKLDTNAHSPRRLLYGEARGSETEAPPSKAEVDAALKELKGSRRGGRGAGLLESFGVLVRSEDPAAIDFVKATLRSLNGSRTAQALNAIADGSPPAWYVVPLDYVDHRDAEQRTAAADCLGELGNAKALPALQKQWRVEKEPETRKALLRAMVGCGPADKTTASAVKSVVEDRKQPADLRKLAVAAASALADKKVVEHVVTRGLDDDDAGIRGAAAYVVGARRDASLRTHVRAALETEKEPAQRTLLEAADKAVDGGPLTAFAAIERELEGKPERGRRGRDR